MAATIHIKKLKVDTIIGIFEHERKYRQQVIINIDIDFDDTKAVLNDDVNYTIDYKKLKLKIMKYVEESSFFLLESLVDRICKIVLQDNNALKVRVEIDKPHALRFAESVSIEKIMIRDEIDNG